MAYDQTTADLLAENERLAAVIKVKDDQIGCLYIQIRNLRAGVKQAFDLGWKAAGGEITEHQ